MAYPASTYPKYGGGGEYPGALIVNPTTDSGYRSYASNGRLFLPAATNYFANPSFELDTNGDGLADGMVASNGSATGVPIFSRVSGRTGGYAQRVQYTGVAGDTGAKTLVLEPGNLTLASLTGLAVGDAVTLSAYLKGSSVGCVVEVVVQCYDAGWASLGSFASSAMTDSSVFTRYSVSGTIPVGTVNLMRRINVSNIGNGDTVDFVVDDMMFEKSSILTPFFDGSFADCSWTGTANASTSVRAQSGLNFPAVAGITNVEAGTIVACLHPLFSSTNKPSTSPVLCNGPVTGSAGSLYFNTTSFGGSSYMFTLAANRYVGFAPDAFAIGDKLRAISRWNTAKSELILNNQNASNTAQPGDTRSPLLNTTNIGGNGYTYIGPVAICPARLTDAETALLSAGLTAGWRGADLYKFFKQKCYGGTMIIPLEGDAKAYIVPGGRADNYTYTGVSATTDTGYETYQEVT